MHIKLRNVEAISEALYEKIGVHNLLFITRGDAFKNYQNLLKEIANERAYTEGEEILPSDLERIKDSVKGIIDIVGQELADKTISRENQLTYNAFPTMLALSDYLFATASKELGCPDIKSHFGKDVEEKLKLTAKNVNKQIKSEVLNTVVFDEYYNYQRYKDADIVRASNKELITACSNKTADPLQLTQLTAEYLALYKRQQGHGRIWRFFHKEENIKRTELLKDMKAAIRKMAGNIEPWEYTPQEVANITDAKSIDRESANQFKEEVITERNNLDWKMFTYAPKDSQRADAERQGVANENVINQENSASNEINEVVAGNEEVRVKMELNPTEIDGQKNDEIVSSVVQEGSVKETSISANA